MNRPCNSKEPVPSAGRHRPDNSNRALQTYKRQGPAVFEAVVALPMRAGLLECCRKRILAAKMRISDETIC